MKLLMNRVLARLGPLLNCEHMFTGVILVWAVIVCMARLLLLLLLTSLSVVVTRVLAMLASGA